MDLDAWRASIDQKLAAIEQWQRVAEATNARLLARVENIDEFVEGRTISGAEYPIQSITAVSDVHNEIEATVTYVCSQMPGASSDYGMEDGSVQNSIGLHHSIWDAAILIGCRRNPDGKLHISVPLTLLIVLLLLLNVMVEVSCLHGFFFTVSKMRYAEFNDDSLIGQELQRFNFNQHVGQFDGVTLQTREQMTCQRMYPSLLSSFYDDVAAYLQHSPGDTGISGPYIAFISMLIWTCSMIVNFRRLLDVFLATCHLPGTIHYHEGKWVRLHNIVPQSSIYYISFVGFRHKFKACTLLILRAASCSLLLCAGLTFLATTYQVEDLILNACALEIIKNFQVTIMDAVVSPDLIKKLDNTRIKLWSAKAALRWSAPETLNSTSVGSIFGRFRFVLCRLSLLLGTLTLASALLLHPFVERVELAEKNICGGDVNFVWVAHPRSQFPVVSQPQDDDAVVAAELDVKCYEIAKLEVLKLRAGMTTHYLNYSLDHCEGTSCPQIPRRIVQYFHDTADLSYSRYVARFAGEKGDAHHWAFNIVREVCLHADFQTPSTAFFEEAERCENLSVSAANRRPDGSPLMMAGSHGLTHNWQGIVMKICGDAITKVGL